MNENDINESIKNIKSKVDCGSIGYRAIDLISWGTNCKHCLNNTLLGSIANYDLIRCVRDPILLYKSLTVTYNSKCEIIHYISYMKKPESNKKV